MKKARPKRSGLHYLPASIFTGFYLRSIIPTPIASAEALRANSKATMRSPLLGKRRRTSLTTCNMTGLLSAHGIILNYIRWTLTNLGPALCQHPVEVN
jgi:hypothetical protein